MAIANLQKANREKIRDHVASAVFVSLVRVTGGGAQVIQTTGDDPNGLTHNNARWEDELAKISHSCVSFPNGTPSNNSVDGKPHDVEVRAALILFHRLSRGPRGKRACSERPKSSKRCKGQSVYVKEGASEGPPQAPLPDSSESTTTMVLDFTSDLGTHRQVGSVRALADLIAIELEKELANDSTSQSKHEAGPGPTDRNSRSNEPILTKCNQDEERGKMPFMTFSDIRPDESGVICLVSKERSRHLRAAGRMPCPHCVKWLKGTKGLWWHQLSVHGINYSSATATAASEDNSLAIVPYRDISSSELKVVPQVQNEKQITRINEESSYTECHGFELVKSGDFHQFVKLVENGYEPVEKLDRNGASIIHWAAGCGRLDFVSYLVEKCGCNPNHGQRGKRSFMGRTPLHWSARNGHLNVVSYLIDVCKVDIEAKTSDGTTAFCWASWQGHLDVMKYLYKRGCDIHATNKFGCNAVLWCAQGAGTVEILSWLFGSGCDYGVVNSNGHSVLHKAAQRGINITCKWLVDNFLLRDEYIDGFKLIEPDLEGNCPSDLSRVEGHENLAQWISKQECDFVVNSYFLNSPSDKNEKKPARMINSQSSSFNNQRLPEWFKKERRDAMARDKTIHDSPKKRSEISGVERMVLHFIEYSLGSGAGKSQEETRSCLTDID